MQARCTCSVTSIITITRVANRLACDSTIAITRVAHDTIFITTACVANRLACDATIAITHVVHDTIFIQPRLSPCYHTCGSRHHLHQSHVCCHGDAVILIRIPKGKNLTNRKTHCGTTLLNHTCTAGYHHATFVGSTSACC